MAANEPDAAISDQPDFEVVCDGHRYRIWSDGRTEGFPPASNRLVINRIPLLVAKIMKATAEEIEQGA